MSTRHQESDSPGWGRPLLWLLCAVLLVLYAPRPSAQTLDAAFSVSSR